MPGARCTRSLACKMKRAHEHSHHRSTGVTRHSRTRMVLTAYFALSPVIGYRIHTFGIRRVVPYLMRRNASRPIRITFGPGFP